MSRVLLIISKGFTIIELIVAVAIVAVLAVVVAVNVLAHIQRAQNASMTVIVDNISKYAAIYFVKHYGTYKDFFEDDGYQELKDGYLKIYPDHNPTERMNDSYNAYCVCYDLKGGYDNNKHTLCVDSSGYKEAVYSNKNCGWRCQSSGVCRAPN